MDIQRHLRNNCLALKVIPRAKKQELKEENGLLKLYLKSAPEKDKANAELIKFFKLELNLQVQIKKGEKSREKVLEVV